MQEKEFLSLLSDTTFKYLFKSDYGRIYLNIILQYLTSINIENYILIDNELNSGTKNKDYKTDILLYNEKDKIIINIEMNQFPSDITIYRNYSYISRIVSDLFHKGDKIEKYKVIQVNFNNSYYKYDNRINNLSFVLRDKNYGYELDIVKIIEVYIPTYKGICYNGKNREEMFLSMFNAKSYNEFLARMLQTITANIQRAGGHSFFPTMHALVETTGFDSSITVCFPHRFRFMRSPSAVVYPMKKDLCMIDLLIFHFCGHSASDVTFRFVLL